MISASSKRNKIANYMDSLPEEFEVLEDNLGETNPVIKLQTKSRILTLFCDDKGKVIEDFEMREGAGQRDEFLAKQEAYSAVNSYYNDYYTGAKIKKSSFEEGSMVIELENRIVTLTYDANSKSIEEKDKPKKSAQKKDYQQMTLFDLPKKEPSKKETAKEQVKEELPITEPVVKEPPVKVVKKSESKYDKWSEGTKVKNVCNNKIYTVKKDEGNIIEVFDKEYGYLIMARADLVLDV